MLKKNTRMLLALFIFASPLFADNHGHAADANAAAAMPETPPAEPPPAEAPPMPVSELSEQEIHEMLGFLTALGGGVATLELDASGIAEMADGLVRMLKEEIDVQALPQAAIEAAFAEAQARAEAVQSGAEELPAFSEGSLEKIGMIMTLQSGISQLGFGAAEADAIRAGFLEGAKVTEPPAELEAKMPAFQAYIQKRIAAAQSEMETQQAAAREAAMAEFKPIADEWSEKDDINVVLETTEGEIELELYPAQAPLAVANFVGHINAGYYDGLTFHRVIEGFMIQGGDPEGTGAGGESIWGKPFPDEFTDELRFDEAGLLAMANAGPMTNGSQFFITTSEPAQLNDKHTIFGKVVDGYDNVKAIEQTETGARDKPVEDQKITKAYVKK